MDARDSKQRARRLFMELADLAATERSAALARACGGDAALRAEVEALLDADRAAGAFLSNPTGPQSSAIVEPASNERPGAQIGRYKLLERIGEGGMGTIWMAEQREPVKRRVALKIIKLGMDTKSVIARFEAERQALALMDHPHIAKVLDAGATETGRPYFVMEYIRGVPILEYCDTERLDTRARLELFTRVCHAIQHAHQKGIIHRDIKPSNVLITLHDGVPVPKVIDFGIAKATNSELTTKTLFTEHRQMIGTPAYMSPEQAEMSGLDIDTRSDVYSLGVLLYELLTGTTPFDTQKLLESGFNEMLRAIREDEPHKPSTRIASLGDTGTRTALQRRSELRKLSLLLRGDLDWIAMKCLEKDRTRRYETANGLARDIQRHLADEPVSAGPPSAAYRLSKLVRRNRVQVVAAAIVAAALVLGFAGAGAGWWKALREKQRADTAAKEATLAADAESEANIEAQENAARAIAEAQRASEAAEAEARARTRAETITNFVLAALGSGDSFAPGGRADKTILEAMDDAVRDLDEGRFAQDAAAEITLRSMIGVVQFNNGQQAKSAQQAARVLALTERVYSGDHEEVVVGLLNLAQALQELGRLGEAEPLCRRALAMSEKLAGPESLLVASALRPLAMVLYGLDRSEEAEPLAARAVELCRLHIRGDDRSLALAIGVLAMQRHALGRLDEAERGYSETLEMLQRLNEGDHPDVAEALNNVAMIQRALGRLEEAGVVTQRSVEMYERIFAGDHPEVARGLNNLSVVVLELGRPDEADALAQRAVEMYRRLYPGDHPDTAFALEVLSDTREGRGRASEAESAQRESIAMFERLYDPEHPRVLRGEGLLALHLWDTAQLDRAIPLFEEVVRKQERVLGPDHEDTLVNVGNLGAALRDAGRLAEALPLLERAYRGRGSRELYRAGELHDAYRRLALAGEPGIRERAVAFLVECARSARSELASSETKIADRLAECGKGLLDFEAWPEAEIALRECVAIRDRVAPDAWVRFNAKAMLGGALLGRGEPALAEPLLIDGVRGMLEREAAIASIGLPRIDEALERLVRVYEALGRDAEAAMWRDVRAARQQEDRK